MARVFFVVDLDHDFKGDLFEAAIWLESQLDRSQFNPRAVAYGSIADMAADADEQVGAFAPREDKR